MIFHALDSSLWLLHRSLSQQPAHIRSLTVPPAPQLMPQLQLGTCVLAVYVRHAEMALLEGEGAWGYSLKIGYPSGWIVMYTFEILFYYF